MYDRKEFYFKVDNSHRRNLCERRICASPMKTYHVYILTNWNNKVMYIGVSSNLDERIYAHKHKLIKGFAEKYNVNKLVYFEETNDVYAAVSMEKQIKKWRREKKNQLLPKLSDSFANSLSSRPQGEIF